NDNELGQYYLHYEKPRELLFCENETNVTRLFNQPGSGSYKDAINDYIVIGKSDVLNKDSSGTKLGIHYEMSLPAHSFQTFRLNLNTSASSNAFAEFEKMIKLRLREADEFYGELQHEIKSEDGRNIQRQALAGMLWTKQFYYFNVCEWLNGDPGQPKPPEQRKTGRDSQWFHLNNADIISMPDKWEYPWYAAWDLAFHCIPLAMIDAELAKHQLILLTKEWYMHPNGQLPAYEWSFSDVNPPVHAWAAWRIYKIDRKNQGNKADIDFLERVYHKLLLNFTWWVNRKDKDDRNIFQGGFLGLDNIGVFDRSKALPTGGYLEQSDGTSWMAMYCLNMMRISLELALHKSIYQDMATKFLE
ncbi:MAG: glucosidase, partial [Calditrichota bacterium]